VDVWLNTPRRPLEASGTSGMKVAFNAGLNLSILDGWWCEGYQGNNGWAIGKGEVYEDVEYQNQVEVRALYELLEKEVVPHFYERGADGIPRSWVGTMKNSLQSLCPVFSTDRMVEEYTQLSYIPSFRQWTRLVAEDLKLARDLALWKEKTFRAWSQVKIEAVEAKLGEAIGVGSSVPVTVKVHLGDIPVEHISVEVYFGVLDYQGTIRGGETIELTRQDTPVNGIQTFAATIECRFCGRYGLMARAMPRHPVLGPVYEPGHLIWG